jgi:hypothetical protein
MSDLTTRGSELASLVFGDDPQEMATQFGDSSVLLIHDVASSKIPFEMILGGKNQQISVGRSFSRRLATSDIPVDHIFAKPPKQGRLEIALVVNPTSDLLGTEREANAIVAALKAHDDSVKIVEYRNGDASITNVFFNGPGESQNGLVLADGELTLSKLRTAGGVPRVTFFNACEAGRVRGLPKSPGEKSAAFAEFVLRSGVQAYVGTYWQVLLFDSKQSDWANYILYGDGMFKLINPIP